MDLQLIIASAVTAFACCLIFRQVYVHLRSGFFFYLPAAFLSLGCAGVLFYLYSWPPAEAASDASMALFGILMTAAAASLKGSFVRAGERDD